MKCTTLQTFNLNYFLKNPHIQTLFAPLFRKQSKPHVEVEDFVLCGEDENERLKEMK